MRKLVDRSPIVTLILSLVTAHLYAAHVFSTDLNEACKEDGKETAGLVKFLLLSLVTCGIYTWVWWYGTCERMNNYCAKHGQNAGISGGSCLLWMILGSCLCGIGPLVALYKAGKALNVVAATHNAAYGL